MKITADTNLLIRLAVRDDFDQAAMALKEIERAERVAISVSSLCEFAWVLKRTYKREPHLIAEAIRILLSADNITIDDAAVSAGLAVLDAGGDFADGVIAYEGAKLGGETFVSFDRQAIAELRAVGFLARTPQ